MKRVVVGHDFEPEGDLNLEYLNAWDSETLQVHSRGHLMLGPMRFMQYRVKPRPCARVRNESTTRECYPEYYNQMTRENETI